jgi:hypothetical protein
MQKRVLAIYYSQTGQLGDIIDSFTGPLREAGAIVDHISLQPGQPYSFPWSSTDFFEIMPDCVMGVPGTLKPFNLPSENYDLVILGYQPWFLSPSIPSNTLLHDPIFAGRLKDVPVITITGARNMWISAHGRLRALLTERGANLVGNIALVDRHPNLVSLVTIMHWMFNGKKDRYLGIFPNPGVSKADIGHMAGFGWAVLPHLERGDWKGLQEELVAAGAVAIKDHLMVIELNGARIFGIWAGMIVRRKNRKPWLTAFKYYIMVALLLLGPLVFVVTTLLLKPLFGKRLTTKKNHYLYLN